MIRGESWRAAPGGGEDWSFHLGANEMFQVREVLLIDDGNDAGLVSLARAYLDSLSIKVDVSDVQVDQLLSPEPEPEQALDDAPVPKGGSCDKQFLDLGHL